jgi:hypothetical protein
MLRSNLKLRSYRRHSLRPLSLRAVWSCCCCSSHASDHQYFLRRHLCFSNSEHAQGVSLSTITCRFVPTLSMVFFLALLLLSTTTASAVSRRSLVTRQAVSPDSTQPPWSEQDILTLVGVCVAVITVIIAVIAVLIASPKLCRWLYKPFGRFIRYLGPSQCLRPKSLYQ